MKEILLMKRIKWGIIVLAMLLAAGLSGCGAEVGGVGETSAVQGNNTVTTVAGESGTNAFPTEKIGVGFMMKQSDDSVKIYIYQSGEDGYMIVNGNDYYSEQVFDGSDYYGTPCFRIVGRRLSSDLVYVETLKVYNGVGDLHLYSSYSIYQIKEDGFALRMRVDGNQYTGKAVYTDLRNTQSEETKEYDISAKTLSEFFKDYGLEFQDGDNLYYKPTSKNINSTICVSGGELILDETNNYKVFPTVAHVWYEATHRSDGNK